MSSTLHFPSESVIKNYLENKHPLTKNDSLLIENKVLAAAARTFADQDKAPAGIQLGLNLILHDFGYNVAQPEIMNTIMFLSAALKDCAEGKKF